MTRPTSMVAGVCSGIRKIALVLGAIMGVVWAPLVARADSTPTPPAGWMGNYSVVSPDARYLLVMLGYLTCDPCVTGDDWVGKSNNLSENYLVSGLYRNDGSAEPLWTMGYVSWQKGVIVSPDGHHLVVWGGWPTQGGEYREEAFSVYEDGKPIKRYEVRDLVANPEGLPHTVSHYKWVEKSEFDGGRNLLMVRTVMGEEYSFDMGTGDVVSAVVPTSVAVVQKAEATVEATVQVKFQSSGIEDLIILNSGRQTPGLSVEAVMAVGVVGLGCFVGGAAIARRGRRRRYSGRVRRVVWRVPVGRGQDRVIPQRSRSRWLR